MLLLLPNYCNFLMGGRETRRKCEWSIRARESSSENRLSGITAHSSNNGARE